MVLFVSHGFFVFPTKMQYLTLPNLKIFRRRFAPPTTVVNAFKNFGGASRRLIYLPQASALLELLPNAQPGQAIKESIKEQRAGWRFYFSPKKALLSGSHLPLPIQIS